MEFRKDVFAIAVGGFLGAMLAHSMSYFWQIGLLIGCVTGYLIRALTEPQRVIDALTLAFKTAYGWWPLARDWKLVLLVSWDVSLVIGGIMGTLLTVLLTVLLAADFAVASEYTKLWFVPLVYLAAGVSMHIICFLFVLLIYSIVAFFGGSIPSRTTGIDKEINFFYVNYLVAKYAFIGIRRFPKFLKIFLVFLHSESFTACGVYALISATAIFLFVPYNPILISLAAVVGGILGAYLRTIILAVLQPQSS